MWACQSIHWVKVCLCNQHDNGRFQDQIVLVIPLLSGCGGENLIWLRGGTDASKRSFMKTEGFSSLLYFWPYPVLRSWGPKYQLLPCFFLNLSLRLIAANNFLSKLEKQSIFCCNLHEDSCPHVWQISELRKESESGKKEMVEIQMLAEEQVMLLRQQLVAIKRALASTESESNEVRRALDKEVGGALPQRQRQRNTR